MRRALVLAVVLGAVAAEAKPVRDDDPTLAKYVKRARQHNRELGARKLETEKRRAEKDAARAAYFPTLDLDGRYTQTYGETLDIGKLINPAYATLNQLTGMNLFPTDIELQLPFRYDLRLRLTQPVFAPRVWAGNRLASAGVAAADAERAVAERDIVSGVRVAYLQHARAAMAVKLLQDSKPLFEEGLRLAELLASADKATGEAVPRARAELANIEQQTREVERLRDYAGRQLNLLVGAPIEDPVPVTELEVIEPPNDIDDLLATAKQRRGELAVIAAGQDAHDAEESLAKAGYLPSLAIVLDYGFLSNDAPTFDNDYFAFSAVASWNLFAGGRDYSKARAAELDREALAMRRLQLEDKIELEVRQAWTDAETAFKAIKSSDERIASVKTAFDIVSRRYKAGAAPQIDLFAARTALLQAQTDRIVAITDLHVRLVELDRVSENEQ